MEFVAEYIPGLPDQAKFSLKTKDGSKNVTLKLKTHIFLVFF